MTSQSALCRLCFNNAEDKNLQVINTNIQDMLRTLLINIDVTANENPVICWACHRKLEKHYCFKKKCIFTEDTLSPFVAEYVKINLNEIRNQIIKSEVEVEKNVCRLCLQYSDDDMTLNEDETQQFQGLLPEINLNLTNFVVLCLTCYNTLHKYFAFVASFYSNQVSTNTLRDLKCSMNVEESDEKNLLLTGKMGMKSEGDSSDFLEDKLDIGLEQIINIKSEDTKSSLMHIEESDDDDIKPMLLHEELDIKCDGDSSDKEFLYANSSSIDTSFKLQPKRPYVKNQGLEEANYSRSGSGSLFKENCTDRKKDIVSIYRCEECNYKSKYKAGLKSHMICHHTNSAKVKMYKCDKYDYEFKFPTSLTKYVLMNHTDPFKTQMYKCEEKCSFETSQKACLKNHLRTCHISPEPAAYKCHYESKLRSGLMNHIRYQHTDTLKIKMHKCDKCDYETRFTTNLKRHILLLHTNPSEILMHKCKECSYESKWRDNLRHHCIRKHMNSEFQMIECKECSYKTKHKADLKLHMIIHATNLSDITMYKCDKCDFETKWRKNLKKHFTCKHIDSSQVVIHKCKECRYETRHKPSLKRHMLTHATNLSEITTYKCDKCDFESNWRHSLKIHCISKHTDSSKIYMIKCNECSYETKRKENLKRHMLTHATNLSEITMYKCDKCDYEFKRRQTLKRHFISKHTDSSEIQMQKCKDCNYETKHKSYLTKHMRIHAPSLSGNRICK